MSSTQGRPDGPRCPCCRGCGQITGPKSMVFYYDPDDPFNCTVRECEECEGTGVVSRLRAAALEAESMQRVMAIVDRVFPEGHVASVKAAIQLEKDMGL